MGRSSGASGHLGRLGFGIDRGGTFTDVFVIYPDGECRTFKLLSEDRQNYEDAPTEAIRRILSEYTGEDIPRGQPIGTKHIAWIRMGTTVATNALLERKGAKMALLITKGFKDLLYIGNQSRPKIFDFDIQIPSTLYEQVVEVEERVLLEDSTCQMNISGKRIRTQNGQTIILETPVNLALLKRDLILLHEKGIRSLAVLLMHSYIYPDHEEAIGRLAQQIGFSNVSLSSHVIPMIKAVPRGFTTCADAYLTPIIQKYIQSFRSGFENNLANVQLEFMQSDGGLCPVESFIGSRAILSGPAGGVVGVCYTAYDQVTKEPVIGFDMGGTSTDVSRYAGQFAHVVDSVTAGIAIQAPQLEVNTVAAGGGSRLFFRDGLFLVGPESAGSDPGPVCYRKGGYLTVTDANLVLGRILPQFFPHIFGPDEQQPLDKESSMQAFLQLTEQVNTHLRTQNRPTISAAECALGFIQVANESMCRPIRTLTEAKGFDTSQHVLSCFGGAGGQHACAIARSLGMHNVKVHKHAGVLSAYGLVLADVVNEQQEAWMKPLNDEHFPELLTRFTALEHRAQQNLLDQGFEIEQIHFEHILHMRYERTDCLLLCQPNPLPPEHNKNGGFELKQFLDAFAEQYQREFGFTIPDRPVIADDIRIRATATRFLLRDEPKQPQVGVQEAPRKLISKCFFQEGELDTGVYELTDLRNGHIIDGPAIIIDKNCTILIEPNCRANITPEGNVHIELLDVCKNTVGTELDPIQLSIFSHRFMSIAEQMGTVLQRSSISTNIKERLDFSCALFGPDGGLVANAPHIPVHLGGMQAAVRFQIEHIGLGNFQRRDVILCNHPKAGGSHLPDLTVITPVFFSAESKVPDFFVANRGHHSDIGGLVPGSMPPHSTSLEQEGAKFVSFKIIDKGQFMEQQLIDQLMAPGRVAGCSGTRNLRDNMADLNAQIAANHKGIGLLQDLVNSYTLPVVKAYMEHIQSNAEQAVRQLLRKVAKNNRELRGMQRLSAEDWMDDGTPIRLSLQINEQTGDVIFDFAGTGPQVHHSCNTPPAVLMAAVIYCLRCLVGRDIPLNQGCLTPVKLMVPPGTILSPSDGAAVVGGNVLTSQRLCDVILRAFDAVAASQGCMNNLTFGDEHFGYYETVGGGAGAGPGWNGRSGVHTHMTNTRITDVEVLEQRYPVIVRRFQLRPQSGGRGQYCGGDGISRHLQFRRPLQLSLLTERRVFAPYGLHGGCAGERGQNLLCRPEVTVNLSAKSSVAVKAGDILRLETPGGGGYGLRRFWLSPPSDTTQHYFGFRRNDLADNLPNLCNEEIENKFADARQHWQEQNLDQFTEIFHELLNQSSHANNDDLLLITRRFLRLELDQLRSEGLLSRLLFVDPDDWECKRAHHAIINSVNDMDDTQLRNIDKLQQQFAQQQQQNQLICESSGEIAPQQMDARKHTFMANYEFNTVAIEDNNLDMKMLKFVYPREFNSPKALKLLDLSFILSLHAEMFNQTRQETAADVDRLRTEDVSHSIFNHKPPRANLVPDEMHHFFAFLNNSSRMIELKQMHPVEFAAIAHFYLLHINPFTVGNGILARHILNLVLMCFAFPPIIIQKKNVHCYNAALSGADNGDLRLLIRLVADRVEQTLDGCVRDGLPYPMMLDGN